MANPLPLALRERAGVIAAIAVTIVLTLLTSLASNADAGKSLVTVFADGEERSISTTVLTVGEALESAGVVLAEKDLVEPSLDTFINQASFSINVYRARPITIVDGQSQQTVMSPYNSPKLIAESAGLTIYDEDLFEFELIDDILATGALGQRLLVDRATLVKVSVYGEIIEHRTHALTVGEVLDEMGIILGAEDQLNTPEQLSIEDASLIAVVRTGTDVLSETVPVEHEIEYIYDNNMFAGQTEVKSAGEDGLDLVTYEIVLENGVEVSRREISRVVEQKPVTEVQVVGTKVADPSSNVAIGQSMAAANGWVGAEWQCLYSPWQKESNWNHLAENVSSGAYGIPQSLPGNKMSAVAPDWSSNPATQITWGIGYITGRYTTPCGAWDHSVANGWY